MGIADKNYTTNDNRRTNVSVPIGSQSNTGPSNSIYAGGAVTLSNEILSDEALGLVIGPTRDLIDQAGNLADKGSYLAEAGIGLASDVVDRTIDLADVAQDTHRDNLNFLSRTIDGVGGAVKDLIDDSLSLVDRNSERFVDYTRETGRDVIDLADGTNQRFIDYTSESQDNLFDAVERNTKLVNDVVDQVIGVVDRTADNNSALSASVLDYAEDLNTENVSFLSNTFDRFLGSVEDMNEQASYDRAENFQFVTATVDKFIGSVKDLNEQAAYDRADNIEAISELGQIVATGGESLQTNLNKLIGVGSILVLGVVAWQAVRS